MLANCDICGFIAKKLGVMMMACPYFQCSKRGSCKVFSGLYQPRQQEKERLCLTEDYNTCEIYHYYETTCEQASFESSQCVGEAVTPVLG